jgi:hypothetical protein
MLYFPEIFFFSVSGTHFYQRLSKPQGLMLLEGLGKLKKFNDLIRSQTHNLLAYGSQSQILYVTKLPVLILLKIFTVVLLLLRAIV